MAHSNTYWFYSNSILDMHSKFSENWDSSIKNAIRIVNNLRGYPKFCLCSVLRLKHIAQILSGNTHKHFEVDELLYTPSLNIWHLQCFPVSSYIFLFSQTWTFWPHSANSVLLHDNVIRYMDWWTCAWVKSKRDWVAMQFEQSPNTLHQLGSDVCLGTKNQSKFSHSSGQMKHF